MAECRLCSGKLKEVFTGKVLTKYDVKYYLCEECSLLQTESPYWLAESYNDSIAVTDTGILLRNNDLVQKTVVTLSALSEANGRREENLPFIKRLLGKKEDSIGFGKFTAPILDYGGGYGLLVRLLRDVGLDAYWYDLYTQNLFAKGFEMKKDEKYSAVIAFEVFEHFPEPLEQIGKIIQDCSPDFLIFSTVLYGENPPEKDWWYYSFESGQHVAFYSRKTLQWIADKFSLKLYSNGIEFHVLSKKDLPKEKLEAVMKNVEKNFHSSKRNYDSKTFPDHLFMVDRLRSGK